MGHEQRTLATDEVGSSIDKKCHEAEPLREGRALRALLSRGRVSHLGIDCELGIP